LPTRRLGICTKTSQFTDGDLGRNEVVGRRRACDVITDKRPQSPELDHAVC
jgi:hypothetical protein